MDTLFILIGFGIVFGGVGGYLFWSEWQFFKRAIRLPGVVVDYASQRGSKGGTIYAPIAAFEIDGEQRRVTGSVYSSGKPEMGKQCTVGVDPYDITKARIYSKGNYVFYGIFLVVGVAMLVGGLIGFLVK